MKKFILLFHALLIVSVLFSQTTENNYAKQKEIKVNSESSGSFHSKKNEIPNYKYQKEFTQKLKSQNINQNDSLSVSFGFGSGPGKLNHSEPELLNQNPDLLKSSEIEESQIVENNRKINYLFSSHETDSMIWVTFENSSDAKVQLIFLADEGKTVALNNSYLLPIGIYLDFPLKFQTSVVYDILNVCIENHSDEVLKVFNVKSKID
jgi:hypothetical protein